jgi:hypothetical protein
MLSGWRPLDGKLARLLLEARNTLRDLNRDRHIELIVVKKIASPNKSSKMLHSELSVTLTVKPARKNSG